MASARKLNTIDVDDSQLHLIYAEDAQFRYWESHLFNEVYLKKDLPEKHSEVWNNTETLEFQSFYKVLRDLAEEYKDRDRELTNWSETETINNWVKHILISLGWANNCTGVQNPFLEETSFRYNGKTYRTDILLVDHPKEKQYINQSKGDDKITEARQSVLIPVEVKYWQRLEEYRQGSAEARNRTDSQLDDISKTFSPNEQITQYMQILKRNWGILTDGSRWRLFNGDLSSEDTNRYYEFNLYSLIQSINTEETEADRLESLEASKYFYFFFSKSALFPEVEGQESLVEEVLRYSKKYVTKVEEDLKDRFVKAMNIACNSLMRSVKSAGIDGDLDLIRSCSESILFNVLFTKSLESRCILPMGSTDYRKLSLSSIVDKIERFDPARDEILNNRDLERAFSKGNGNAFKYSPEGTQLHERMIRLAMIIHDGSTSKESFGFEIDGFRESVFTTAEWNLFKKCKISNYEWVKIIFQLGYANSESLNRKFQQIPYGYFTARQLGSIYESFLEFQIQKADIDMVFEKKQWKKADLQSIKYKNADLPKVKKGELFFTPNNKDRKVTGSYYTPDCVVEYLVEQTLGPIVANCKAEDILKLKICDPAMGSGHFLAGALHYLTAKYLDRRANESEGDLVETVSVAKRKILDSCIFGVDINSRAVKLAKMSLWLETAVINQKLEKLSDQLLCADSLITDGLWKKSKSLGTSKFDALIGNPPYVSELRNNKSLFEKYRLHTLTKEYYEAKMDIFHFFIQRGLDFIKDGGSLGYIIPQYWLTRSNTLLLHKKIATDSKIALAIDFGSNKVFPSAPGMHSSIIVLSKTDFVEGQEAQVDGNSVDPIEIMHAVRKAKVKPLTLEFDPKTSRFSKKTKVAKDAWYLGDEMIAQGVVAPQENVIKSHIEKIAGLKPGEGIFVLNDLELKRLKLTKSEESYVRPFIEASDLKSPLEVNWDKKWVLYIDSKTNKALMSKTLKLPNIQKHMDKYSKIITSSNAPYGLHRARTTDLFDKGSKILSVRKGKKQCFVWTQKEMVVNQAVLVIQSGSEWTDKLLTIYFNSKECFEIFRNSKTQGDIIQVDKENLLRIPIPKFLKEIEMTAQNVKKLEGLLEKYDWESCLDQLLKLRSNAKAA